MPDWERDTGWRQGHVLSAEAAIALGLVEKGADSGDGNEKVVVVISHDCDIAQTPDLEPLVEVMVGVRIATLDGNYTFGKNARKLHLPFAAHQSLRVELLAGGKQAIQKNALASFVPDGRFGLTVSDRNILQRWLASRYRRSAFPDEFDRRLSETGVRNKIRKILKRHGAEVSAIYFDVDDGEEVVRTSLDDQYSLSIHLLYDTSTDPSASEARATKAKAEIETAFKETCFSSVTRSWHSIELIECLAVSDEVMTLRLVETLKRWNVDDISLAADPQQTMVDG
jgi:hypothetical protein